MREIIVFAACVLIWGSTWFAIEFQLGVTPAPWSLTIRFAISALVLMAAVALSGRGLQVPRQGHAVAAAMGFFLFSSNYLCIYISAGYLASGLVAVAFSLLSIFNLVNGRVFLKQTIDPVIGGAALFGVIGLGLIFSEEARNISFEDASIIGLSICLLGTYSASLGNTIAAVGSGRGIALLPLNAWGMAYGTLINIVYALLIGEPFALDTRMSYWVSMIVLALVGTVLAFTLYVWLVGRIGLTKAAYTAVLMPLVALSISTIFEGYVWTVSALGGVGLILMGNILMIRRKGIDHAASSTGGDTEQGSERPV